MPQFTKLETLQLKHEIGQIFTPSAPIDKSSLFAGRQDQISRLINAVSQKGQHAVLYGERGVGKTSLANVLHDFLKKLPKSHYYIGATNCEASSTFSSIWASVLRDIRVAFDQRGAGYNPTVHTSYGTLADLMPDVENAEQVRHFFKGLDKSCVIIIDEVDQIVTEGTAKALADTVKTFSDHRIETTLVLVGVADSVGDLIAQHVSIERALVQIPMPRMSLEELYEIVDRGLNTLKMRINGSARHRIGKLSQGLPHYTHLLALHAAQTAVDADRRNIVETDVTAAIGKSVTQAQQSVVKGYLDATTSRRGNLYTQVITACALAYKDELGYFAAADVRHPMSLIMGKAYEINAFSQHLNDFCVTGRGPILEKTGFPRRYRFRFSNPLMEPFVLMKGLSKTMITSDLLHKLGK